MYIIRRVKNVSEIFEYMNVSEQVMGSCLYKTFKRACLTREITFEEQTACHYLLSALITHNPVEIIPSNSEHRCPNSMWELPFYMLKLFVHRWKYIFMFYCFSTLKGGVGWGWGWRWGWGRGAGVVTDIGQLTFVVCNCLQDVIHHQTNCPGA